MQKSTEDFLTYLPTELRRVLSRAISALPKEAEALSGITLRAERVSSLAVDGKHLPLPLVLSEEELAACFRSLCGDAIYPHEETLAEGYFTLPTGVRIGVSGRASHKGREVSGIYGIDTLSVRLHRNVRNAAEKAEALFRSFTPYRGLLVYAPPGVGKTTLLADLARRLSSGGTPLSVVVIDERGELKPRFPEKNLLLSFLSGFPKAHAIELATRTLSPDAILCDEIGNEAEAKTVLSLANAGVPLLASAHAGSLREFLSRPPLALLWENDVFGAAIGILRTKNGDRTYEIHDRRRDT